MQVHPRFGANTINSLLGTAGCLQIGLLKAKMLLLSTANPVLKCANPLLNCHNPVLNYENTVLKCANRSLRSANPLRKGSKAQLKGASSFLNAAKGRLDCANASLKIKIPGLNWLNALPGNHSPMPVKTQAESCNSITWQDSNTQIPF